jgi:ectoine hydroxylase-related dioxygenase (phytanoyl-CoA dioxygenase family)
MVSARRNTFLQKQSGIIMSNHLSKKLQDSYRSNGFVIGKRLLNTESITHIKKQAHRIICKQLERFEITTQNDLLTDMNLLLQKDVSAYLGSLRLLAKMGCVRNLISSQVIEEAVQDLGCQLATISESPVFHVISDSLKIPNGYFGFSAHQDWTSIQGALDVIVVWIPLHPVNKRTFPLMVIPKSNQKGLFAGIIEENVYKVDESQIDSSQFIPIEADIGDVVFMSGWTVHKTGVEKCSGFRLAISNRWEDAEEPHFIQRDYPSAYKKWVQREWITPDFPSLSQIQQSFERNK